MDYVQDIGAYPTPWPVGSASAVGMLFPGPYRVPLATFTSTSMFSNTRAARAYRGPWQFESVAREVLLDIAARRMGIDPVELRRRNLLAGDELPYASANGMPYDATSRRWRCFEQALEILDYDAFRAEQAEARAAGRYLGVGMSHLRRAHHARLRRLRHRGGDDPHRAVGQGQRVRGRRVVGQQHRDHGRAADGRRARRRHRGRRHHPGRHRGHAVRRRDRRQPQRVDDRRGGRRGGRACCASGSSPSPPTA